MTDTPQNIKELQLKIWLAKPPMERLGQFMEDNARLYEFWAKTTKPANLREELPAAPAINQD